MTDLVWDEKVDLLVIGGGAGGLTAAVVAACEGLSVLVCEKATTLGGTTATSGGMVWIPGSRESLATPTPDNLDEARRYLAAEVGNRGQPELREAFLNSGRAALDYLRERTEVKFKANSPYFDYHSETPGASHGGRTLAPLSFDGRRLGRDFALVRPPMAEMMVFGSMMVGREEIPRMLAPFASVRNLRTALTVTGRWMLDRLRYPRGTRLVLGNALIARLLYSLLKAGGRVATGTALTELVREGGRVVGAVVMVKGQKKRIAASRGVVLATGGSGGSRAARESASGHAVPETLSVAESTGDGARLAEAVGAKFDANHHSPYFWMPASVIRWEDGRSQAFPHIRDRPKPGLIAVNASGQRFVNESASYHDFVMAMQQPGNTPAFLICDRAFLRDYGLGVIYPKWQRLSRFLRLGYLKRDVTLAGLARQSGIDPEALRATVHAHDAAAARGEDPAFGKGGTPYNRFNGDAAHRPNPCLRPLGPGPFFALKVTPAPIGTSVGLKTDADARVLDRNGAVINGLFACGNDMSSIMGGYYPGPGITLGPALVFAFRAAMRAAGRPLDNTAG